MILPYVTQATIVYATTLSLPSFALRVLSAVPAFSSRQEGLGERYINIVSLQTTQVHQIVRAAMIAAAAAGVWWLRCPLATLKSPRYVIEVGCVAAFMLWFSERTWIHHYISFLLTLAAAGMVLSDPSFSERSRRLVRLAVIAFAVSALWASDAKTVRSRRSRLGPRAGAPLAVDADRRALVNAARDCPARCQRGEVGRRTPSAVSSCPSVVHIFRASEARRRLCRQDYGFSSFSSVYWP